MPTTLMRSWHGREMTRRRDLQIAACKGADARRLHRLAVMSTYTCVMVQHGRSRVQGAATCRSHAGGSGPPAAAPQRGCLHLPPAAARPPNRHGVMHMRCSAHDSPETTVPHLSPPARPRRAAGALTLRSCIKTWEGKLLPRQKVSSRLELLRRSPAVIPRRQLRPAHACCSMSARSLSTLAPVISATLAPPL